MSSARRADDEGLLADVRATLGITLVLAGEPRAGLEQLNEAVGREPTPRTLMRRGVAFNILSAATTRLYQRPDGGAGGLPGRA